MLLDRPQCRLACLARTVCVIGLALTAARRARADEAGFVFLHVQARDARGRDVHHVRVFVDGQVLTERLDGSPVLIPIGRHVLRFEAPEGTAVQEEFVAVASDLNPEATIDFDVPLDDKEGRHWYGWQIMITDASAIALGLTATTSGGPWGVAAATTYVLGGPIVHWEHGAVGKGFGSLGLRVLLPLAAAVAWFGACFYSCTGSGGTTAAVALGAFGLLVPPMLDYAALAYEPAPAARTDAGALRLAPALGAVKDTQGRVVPTLSFVLGEF
jgi:hypothetical protein